MVGHSIFAPGPSAADQLKADDELHDEGHGACASACGRWPCDERGHEYGAGEWEDGDEAEARQDAPPVRVKIELAGQLEREKYNPFDNELYPRRSTRARDYGLPDNLSYTGSHCSHQVEASRLGAWEVYMVTAFDDSVYEAHPNLAPMAGIWSKLFTRKWASPDEVFDGARRRSPPYCVSMESAVARSTNGSSAPRWRPAPRAQTPSRTAGRLLPPPILRGPVVEAARTRFSGGLASVTRRVPQTVLSRMVVVDAKQRRRR